jgi:hypothetical protein
MNKYSVPPLLTLAFGALLWAYVIIDDYLRTFSANVSVID